MRRERRGLTGLVVTIVLALVLAACGGGDGGGAEGADDEGGGGPSGTLRVGFSQPNSGFDTHVGVGDGALPFLRPVYDNLIMRDGANYEPWLATDWTYDEAELTWTFTIREGVTFTDGTRLDAAAVGANLERGKEKSLAGENTSRALAAIESTEAVDATTLVVRFAQPYVAFISELATRPGLIMSPAAFDSPDLVDVPVGSGPWKLVPGETVVDSTYVYELNEDYWNPEAQGVSRIEINVYLEGAAAVNALRSGQVDMTSLDPVQAVDVEADADLSFLTVPNATYGFMVLDREGKKVEALGDPRVRRAMAMSIDREAFIDAILGGFGSPSAQTVGEGVVGYQAELDEELAYDPDAARELLEEAGYPDGFSMTVPTNDEFSDALQAIQGFFGEIGIDMELVQLDQTSYLAFPTTDQYPLFFGSFPLANNEAVFTNSWRSFGPGGLLNGFDNEDADVTAVLQEAQTLPDPADRVELNEELVALGAQEGYWIVAAIGERLTAVRDTVVSGVDWTGSDPLPPFYGVTVSS